MIGTESQRPLSKPASTPLKRETEMKAGKKSPTMPLKRARYLG